MKLRKKRLFFCRTPLQALIIREIMRLEEGDDLLVYNPTSLSNKHRIYFEKFSCNKVFVENHENVSLIVQQVWAYLKIRKEVRQPFDEYYIASIGSFLFGLIIGRKTAKVISFDDGTLNLVDDAFTKWVEREPKRDLLYGKILGIPSRRALLDRIDSHCTIYHHVPNAIKVDHYRYISILADQKHDVRRGTLKLLLGIPINVLTYDQDSVVVAQAIEDYELLLKKFGYDVFLPHPAENRPEDILGVLECEKEYVSKLVRASIAEDVVIELIKRGYEVEVYGFGSSALINLSDICDTYDITSYPSIDSIRNIDYDVFEKCGVKRFFVSIENSVENKCG